MSDEIKALVERADIEQYKRLAEAVSKRPWDCTAAESFIPAMSAALTAQADEIERLRARLEITDEITERYDGIACRDETIRLLEQKIAALKAAQEVKS
jgi:hypothetical protein